MKKLFVILLSILTTTSYFLSGCSDSYDYELVDESLEINDNICRTRSMSGDPDDGPVIHYAQNACGIWVIMNMIGSVNSDYYYGKVMKCAESIGWKENDSIGLTSEQIILICNQLKKDSEISSKKNIINLPTQWKREDEAQEELVNISKTYGRKKIQDVSIGVQIEVEVEDPSTGKPQKIMVDHWVVAQYINGDQIYVNNGYRDKYGTKKKFNISDVRAIVY